MAVPRHKTSKSKKGQRRAHHALPLKNASECPRCTTPKLPHRVCGNCGYYRDVQKIEVDAF